MTDETSSLLYFNGVNGETGAYDLPPLAPNDFAALISGQKKLNDIDT
jgi:hypothetical protein